MSISKFEDIVFVYDFRGPSEWLPNGINYFYSQNIFENDGIINQNVTDYFFKNFTQLGVYNANLNVNRDILDKKSIREFLKSPKLKNKTAIYLVEPFGSFEHFIGKQYGGFSETTFLDFVSKESLNEIKTNPNFYLCINYNTEGVFNSYWFKYIYDLLESYDIDVTKVILLSSAVDIKEIHHKIRKHNPNQIKVGYIPWSITRKARELQNIYKNENYKFWDNIDQVNTIVGEEDLDSKTIRNNRFLLMNRRLRPHRMLLLSLLGMDFIKDNLVSFDVDLFGRENDFEFYNHHLPEDEKLVLDAYNESKKLFEVKKSTIDYDDIDSVWGFNFELKEPYLSSYINICTETNFYEDGLYFSEKTWKPIGHLQPFIQVNKKGAIKELQNLGFKTFHPFINEEYDDIESDSDRIYFLKNEINRINSLPIEQIHNWYYSIKDILIYNRDLLFKFADNQENIEFQYLEKLKELCG